MHTGLVAHTPPVLQIQAALAEAWHVDGCFTEAIAGWEALAARDPGCAESLLKAAISCFSAHLYERGFAWLDRARRAGASAEETLYVHAQACWQQGQVKDAIELFRQAEHAAPQLGKASNALGVLYWQLGWAKRARHQFALALQRDPCDAEAPVNLASLSLRAKHTDGQEEPGHLCTLQEARDLLARAAAFQPQRAEAFVWYARLLRHVHAEEEAREALTKARLRGCFRGPISHGSQNRDRADCGLVRVGGQFSPAQARLTLHYIYSHGAALPAYLAVNSGYELITVGGDAPVPVPGEEMWRRFALPPAANIVFYSILANAWRQTGMSASLEVVVVGRPVPPCVSLSKDEIELDGRSGWLPLPLPLLPLRWQIDIRFPPEFTTFVSSDEVEVEAPGLIALRHPRMLSPDTRERADGRITAISCKDSPLLRLAPLLMQRTIALWEEQVGAPRFAYPDVLIVNRPGSLFCYARKNYLRLPSGLARQLELSAQICHEAGHLWWGLDVRFVPADAWLGEALAEYSLHLAEEAGWLTGYRKNALALLRELYHGRLPAAGLAQLHTDPGKDAAYSLRVKGGYLIAMLRTLMGESAFWGFLRSLHEYGSEQQLDAYHFFALASRWHGASLNWFVNQWVYSETSMAFFIEGCQVTRFDHQFSLSFTARSRGTATPGGPVIVAIQCERGEEQRVSVHLNLGRAPVKVILPTRPERIALDPDLCWYAEQEEMTISGGS